MKFPRKKKTVRSVKFYDEKYLGTEPTWTTSVATNIQIMVAYNWYNHYYDRKDSVKLLFDHYPRDKKEVKLLRNIEPNAFSPILGYQARMISRGCKLAEDNKKFFNDKIDELLAQAKSLEKEKKKELKKPTNVISIQDRIREKTSEYIGELEEELDKLFNNKYNSDFNVYEWLQKNEVKSAHAIAISKHYEPLLAELNEVKTKKDPDLVYGYKNLKPAELKRYIAFVESFVNDTYTWGSNQKTVRKARKKKPVSIEKQTSKVQYLKDCKEYKIVSVDPSQIVGANELWVFNVKYRRLTKYEAMGPAGLSFKGTTLQGWNDETSVCKALRKPEQTLASVMDGGKIILRKLMESLKTKEITPNGRINKDTVLLRVTK